jgi:hypothetical protein
MRIGIDLDNTIIDYTEAFLFGARELKLIPEKWKGQKIELKSVIKSHSEGELKWQKLQGKVYGQWIHHAKLYSGVFRFLWRCHQRGWETIVVSHKTEHGHFDSDKISLRDSARDFLLSCQVCESDGEGLLNEIKFESTREQKIQTINDYQCDVFIDDLPEILENREFPLETQRILFDPENQHKTNTLERANSWDDVANVLLGHWSELELKNLSESCSLSAVREVKSISGGRNSRVYKGYAEAGNEFALKIYPADTAHDRLRSEYDGMRTIHSKCTPKAPVPIGVNRGLEATVFGWVDGETISKPAFEDIDQAVEFLSSLDQCRHKIEFDNFPCASAACLSGKQIEEQINSRLELLLTEQNKSLTLFLNKDFFVAFEQVLERAKAMWPNREYDMIINRDQQILSPSDFGFHNALRKKNGSLVFLDFEYFGWDDPVKLMCDFAFHPGMSLSMEMRRYWYQESLKLYGEGLIPRLNASWPLYGLCWVLILLNEFRGNIWKRRCTADSTITDSREDLQQLQFERARNLLKFIDLSVKKQIFDFI